MRDHGGGGAVIRPLNYNALPPKKNGNNPLRNAFESRQLMLPSSCIHLPVVFDWPFFFISSHLRFVNLGIQIVLFAFLTVLFFLAISVLYSISYSHLVWLHLFFRWFRLLLSCIWEALASPLLPRFKQRPSKKKCIFMRYLVQKALLGTRMCPGTPTIAEVPHIRITSMPSRAWIPSQRWERQLSTFSRLALHQKRYLYPCHFRSLISRSSLHVCRLLIIMLWFIACESVIALSKLFLSCWLHCDFVLWSDESTFELIAPCPVSVGYWPP